MSYYGNNEWDDMLYEIREFLKEHNISDLLKIVKDAVAEKEEGYTWDINYEIIIVKTQIKH